MTDLEALYAGICALPDEDTPRLALADYLDEQGGKENEFRADVVRTHLRLAREEPWSVPWRELRARWDQLYATVVVRERAGKLPWLAHLKGRVKAWAFERGLVGHLTLFSKRFVAEGDSYFAQDPIRSVKFVKLNSDIGTVKPDVLFACPHMGRIVKLDLDGSGLKDADLARLARSPCAPVLRALTLSWHNAFGPTAVPKLLKAMPALTELNLQGNRGFKNGHAKALAKCPEFARLTALDVAHTPLTAAGVEALLAGTRGALTALRVGGEKDYGEGHDFAVGPVADRAGGVAVAEVVAASKALAGLRELDLSYRDIGDEGLKVLAGAGAALPALRQLKLDGCGLTPAGVKALAGSDLGGRLLYVSLLYNPNLGRYRAKLKKMFPNAHLEEPFDDGDE